jgi:DNA repair protein RecO (recombination protein O)
VAKYNKAQGIVLKKQNYKESDQIITIWTYEFGKIRVLARAIRMPKSKLAGSLQDLNVINFEVTGRFPMIISSEVVRSFRGIHTNLAKMAPAFYATELMLKTTADEHPNREAMDHLLEFLKNLDCEDDLEAANIALHAFAIKLISCQGFSTEYAQDSFKISPELSELIQVLRKKDFSEIKNVAIPISLTYKLKAVINQLLEYVLERELKSKAFLTQIN